MVTEIVRSAPDPAQRMIAEPMQFESAAWVANRIAEFLPIPPASKQRLMTEEHALDRLAIVHRWLQQQGIL